jgi:hypothetical protein
MKRHAAAVLLVLTLTGCAPDAVDLTAEATPTATKKTEAKAKVKPSPSKTKTAEPIPADLRKYLTENFTGTSWLKNIKAVTKNSDQHRVETDLKPTEKDKASKICSAVSGYQVQEGTDGFTGVRVAAANGEQMVWRKDISESC